MSKPGMNANDIQQIINAMPARMSARGLLKPDANFQLSANVEPYATLTWSSGTDFSIAGRKYEFARAATPREALDKAEAFIAALPSAEETKRTTFLSALAKVVDLGNELGQDVGALASEMKRLSENVITDQRDQRRAA